MTVLALRCCALAFSSCGKRGLLLVAIYGLLLAVLLLLRSMDSRAQAQSLWHTGFIAPRHVGSSHTRDRTCVLSISRQSLNHWTTREIPQLHFK